MSAELYETLSLASRYLFALLGVLIVVRALFWLLSERSERHRRVRQLPWAGTIGEFVVLSGDTVLPEGMSIAVPWEGTLGSVRSCDVFLPCAHVKRKHLSFSFEQGQGLRVTPFSGCEAMVNGTAVDCRSGPEESTLTHGSFLQVGNAVLRLRVLAGLDPQAGFHDLPQTLPMVQPQAGVLSENRLSYGSLPSPAGLFPDSAIVQSAEDSPVQPYTFGTPAAFPPQQLNPRQTDSAEPVDVPVQPAKFPPVRPQVFEAPSIVSSPQQADPDESTAEPPAAEPRRRRSDRWEVDWSE